MRKTVLFIRFALCIAIGLVGSSLFATARAISVPNPFVKAHDLLVEKLPQQYSLASVALAASEKSPYTNAISSSITSQKIVEPTLILSKNDAALQTTTPPAPLVPQPSVISAAIGSSVVIAEDVAPPVVSLTPTPSLSSSASIDSPTPSLAPTGGLNAETLFAMINTTRTQAGLPAFEKNDLTCSVASARAPEIQNEVFGTSSMHAGFYARHIGGATENLISIRSEQDALNWWLNSPVHRSAILGTAKYSCLACSGTSCSEIFSN